MTITKHSQKPHHITFFTKTTGRKIKLIKSQ